MNQKEKKNLFELGLPNAPIKENEHKAIEYVTLIQEGLSKLEAFETVFPERYKRVYDKGVSDRRNPKHCVLNEIGKYEAGKYVKSVYKLLNEHYWTKFVDKRTRILNKIGDMALDDNLDIKEQQSAAKIFLGAVPEAKREDKVVHEIKLAEDDAFVAQLQRRKELLYKAANEDIIDVETE